MAFTTRKTYTRQTDLREVAYYTYITYNLISMFVLFANIKLIWSIILY